MKRLVLRTVLPALLAIGLFSGVVFLYLLPALNRAVMEQKELMIRELTESSWNILARFEAEERAGRLSRAEAQRSAIEQVRSLHYGQEGKDYFWIIDGGPTMIVHPYRPDLEGSDLSGFADPHGKLLFREMVEVVGRERAGYVRYMWQWKDDPRRIVPKLSYVKGFEPWGWIIGTGVYTDDVEAEVAQVTSRLRAAALLILAIVSLLMFVLLRTSFLAERGRLRASAALRASEEKYRSLVEAAGEAIFMSLSGEGLFANASMLRLVGLERDEFASLDVDDFVRVTPGEMEAGRRHWRAALEGSAAPTRYEAELVGSSGRSVRVMLALSHLEVQGRPGFMAVATPLAQPRQLDLMAAETSEDLAAANLRLATMGAMMMTHGADAQQVSRMLSLNADAAVRRAIDLSVAELGAPPAPFEVMLMGSLGRGEVSLLADQDHAIIYDDATGDDAELSEYFLRLGRRLAAMLNAAGYALCPGGIMASEPRCCQSIAAWRRSFSGWIHALEARDLLQAKVFFDFRGATGEVRLTSELRTHLTSEIARQPRFIPLLAHSVLEYEPPLGAFGGFVLEEGASARATFDVKGVLAQVVDIARLRALEHGLTETNTLARIDALAAAGHLRVESARETAEAFRFLTQLRLQHQARRILDQLEPDNRIEPAALDAATRKELKATFAHVKAVQAGLAHAFGRS